MLNFTLTLTHLQAAIAVRAAKDRALTTLLVAVWGRIARMGARLARLVAMWRAGKLPARRASRAGRVRGPETGARQNFPTAPAWLIMHVPDAVGYGLQLEHLLSGAEWAAFLAAVPQAGRILHPLLRMLGVKPLPGAIRKPEGVERLTVPLIAAFGIIPVVGRKISGA